MSPEVTLLPEWIGAAVLGAIIAAIGYVAKLVVEWVSNNNAERNRPRAQLIELESLLRASRVTFLVQKEHATNPSNMIERNHSDLVHADGFEEILTTAYPHFTKDERELHSIIRTLTIHALRPTNESLSEWLKRDTYFKSHYREKTIMGKVARKLADLETHLILWHAKYEAWIPTNPEHALVYMADEQKHGLEFPHGIDELVGKLVANG